MPDATPSRGASVDGVSIRSVTSRKLVIASVCLACLLVCCGLAWWQWDRYASAGGSFQNLGYVLQWPLFGLFPVFMVWRIRKLNQQERERTAQATRTEQATEQATRTERDGQHGTAGPGDPGGADRGAPTTAARTGARPPASDRDTAADRDTATDDALAEYNRYLAELNAREQERN